MQDHLNGKGSQKSIAKALGTKASVIQRWIVNYQSMGLEAFQRDGYTRYSSELKYTAVREYLSGEISLRKVCEKYKIKSETQLLKWISLYNGHKKLKASGTGGSNFMIKGRKTTFEERIEIVQYCSAHDHNYAETSEKYQVSYQQARNYTIKYETDGVDALQDNRGRRKNR